MPLEYSNFHICTRTCIQNHLFSPLKQSPAFSCIDTSWFLNTMSFICEEAQQSLHWIMGFPCRHASITIMAPSSAPASLKITNQQSHKAYLHWQYQSIHWDIKHRSVLYTIQLPVMDAKRARASHITGFTVWPQTNFDWLPFHYATDTCNLFNGSTQITKNEPVTRSGLPWPKIAPRILNLNWGCQCYWI